MTLTPDPLTDAGATPLARLERDGFLVRRGGRLRTTRRWQGAMARAALRLGRAGDPGDDLRAPIAAALLDVYGADVPEAELVARTLAMLPIEAAELSPAAWESSDRSAGTPPQGPASPPRRTP